MHTDNNFYYDEPQQLITLASFGDFFFHLFQFFVFCNKKNKNLLIYNDWIDKFEAKKINSDFF